MSYLACVDIGYAHTTCVVCTPDSAGDPWCGIWQVPTTTPLTGHGDDMVEGIDNVLAVAGSSLGAELRHVRVTSSAGGPARLVVLGIRDVDTENYGLVLEATTGTRLAGVFTGRLEAPDAEDIRERRPDMIVITGDFDGSDPEPYLHLVAFAAHAGFSATIILAGQNGAASTASSMLADRGVHCGVARNLSPQFGTLEPSSARDLMREVAVTVAAGANRSTRNEYLSNALKMTSAAVAASAVSTLARSADDAGGALYIDLGAATTSVHSYITEANGGSRHSANSGVHTTSEGSLGLRLGATNILGIAVTEGLLDVEVARRFSQAALHRVHQAIAADGEEGGKAADALLGELALTIALRRHARPVPPQTVGRDLRGVRRVIVSGNALRPHPATIRAEVMAPATSDHAGGWRVPRHAEVIADVEGRMLAAGLLAFEHPRAARLLLVPYSLGLR